MAVVGLGDLDHLVAGQGRGGRIGAVGARSGRARLRRASPRASWAARIASRPQSSPCAPGLGRERHRRHAGQRLQPVGQLVHQLERALDGGDRLQRMEVGEAGQARQLLVQPRVVLHGARAERIERQVDGVVLLAEPHIVAHRLRLGEAGQAVSVGAGQAGEVGGVGRPAPPRRSRRRSCPSRPARRSAARPAAGRGPDAGVGAPRRRPRGGSAGRGSATRHAAISSDSASAKAAMSSAVVVSVAQTSSTSSSAGVRIEPARTARRR